MNWGEAEAFNLRLVAMHNIPWLGLTSQYKQILHLKAYDGTENNELCVLLKCQELILSTRWTVARMRQVREETAQNLSVCAVFFWQIHLAAPNQHSRDTFALFVNKLTPFIAFTHRPEHKD